MATSSSQDSFNGLFSGLSARQQEVIKSRFGLNTKGQLETLAAIGDRYGITRERVRQIEASALRLLQESVRSNPYFQKVLAVGSKFLKSNSGIVERTEMLSHLQTNGYPLSSQHLGLLLASTNSFFAHEGDENFIPLYYLEQAHFDTLKKFVASWAKHLDDRKGEVLGGGYKATLANFLKAQAVATGVAARYLGLSRIIGTNPYGDTGLTAWPEINPTTIRDRIYLILKKEGKPMHFQSIAEGINKAGFSKRKALAPTVHNELIKDARFVLVGRGMYGLTEHGFEAGTAREVIERILKENGPLAARDVVLAVQKERFIKQNTILVNLQNKKFFKKLENGSYHILES